MVRTYKPTGEGRDETDAERVVRFKQLALRAVTKYVVRAWSDEVKAKGPEWVKCSQFLVEYAIGKPPSSPEDQAAQSQQWRIVFPTLDELRKIHAGTLTVEAKAEPPQIEAGAPKPEGKDA